MLDGRLLYNGEVRRRSGLAFHFRQHELGHYITPARQRLAPAKMGIRRLDAMVLLDDCFATQFRLSLRIYCGASLSRRIWTDQSAT